MGLVCGAQGQVTPERIGRSIGNRTRPRLTPVLVSDKFDEELIKKKGPIVSKIFSPLYIYGS